MLYDGPDDGKQFASLRYSSCGRGVATIISFVVLTFLRQAHILTGIRLKDPNLEIRQEYWTLKQNPKANYRKSSSCTLIQHAYYNLKDLSVKSSNSERCYSNFISCDHALLF